MTEKSARELAAEDAAIDIAGLDGEFANAENLKLADMLKRAFLAGFEAGEEDMVRRQAICNREGHQSTTYPGNGLDLEPQVYCGRCLMDF